MIAAKLAKAEAARILYAPEKQQNHQHEDNESQATAGVVTPGPTVRPCRHGAERDQEQEHDENRNHV
jgi:hypothetical protein